MFRFLIRYHRRKLILLLGILVCVVLIALKLNSFPALITINR